MIPRSRIIVVFVLLALAWAFMLLHKDQTVPLARPLAEVPEVFAGWTMVGETSFSQDVLNVLLPTDYLSRRYRNAEGRAVDLYIGYHGGGEGAGDIHSPKHCMPGSGWLELSSERQRLALDGRTLNLVRTVYAMGGMRQLLFYWYDVQGRTLNDEFSLKIWETLGSMLKSRRDASFIRVSVPFEADEAQADALGRAFVQAIAPVLDDFLPR